MCLFTYLVIVIIETYLELISAVVSRDTYSLVLRFIDMSFSNCPNFILASQ